MNTSRGLLDGLDTTGLNTALSEATCLGMQVEPANAQLKLELDVLTLPIDGPPPADCDVFLTLSGVSRVATSFRRVQWDALEPEILPLTLDNLGDAVRSFGGAALHGWEFFDLDDSSWALWRDLLSFDTTISDRPPTHVLEFSQEEGVDPRELDIRIWFEQVSIQDNHGCEIPVPDFIAGGVRWWEAHNRCDPRTMRPDIVPPL
ncbi:hypothetical protein HLB23_29865 [Nocardia uniformis]|uniref:Uncharacterized protein n=1 Tax=Nocardia uniformis TaxID=53432 RepID=A0A849C5V4_9NOCA|nr:hypothetical protein [Nocardia uniformis]NNH74012.1 hypothetical protein [Nocardia uniformis]